MPKQEVLYCRLMISETRLFNTVELSPCIDPLRCLLHTGLSYTGVHCFVTRLLFTGLSYAQQKLSFSIGYQQVWATPKEKVHLNESMNEGNAQQWLPFPLSYQQIWDMPKEKHL